MLASSDADLARRDCLLPGLSTLLDPDAFATILRASLPEAGIEAAEITYVRYKPGTSCLVGYRLTAADTAVEAYAKAHRPDAQGKLAKRSEKTGVNGPLGPGHIVWQDRAIAISIFPNDMELKALARLSDGQVRRRLLREIVPRRPEFWEGTVRGLRYKPERRYVAQLAGPDGIPAAVLKVHTTSDYHSARANAKAFRSSGPLHVGRWLGCSDRRHVLALEWLPGHMLNEAILNRELNPTDIRIVGAALAELHSQNPKMPMRWTPEAQAAALFSVAAALGVVCPRLARQADSLARRLVACLADDSGLNRPIHGDFYAKQVLLTGDSAAILDLDQAALGDPATDLGLFIAHLERDALRGDLAPSRVDLVRGSLLEGYRDVPARVELFTAAGLFRLAPDPFRCREPDWPERTQAILERADAILAAAPARAVALPGAAVGEAGRRIRPTSIPVSDPFAVTKDPKMPWLAQALHPAQVQCLFERRLTRLAGQGGSVHLWAIRVVRYKPGRRCLIEYDVQVEQPDRPPKALTLVGKTRARGLDESSYRLLELLWSGGFATDGEDGVCVPKPSGVVPELQMWLQRKVPGAVARRLLPEPGGVALAGRIAEAIHKLHQAGIPAHRRHTMVDELRILHERLPIVARLQPRWARRTARVLDACDRLGAAVPEPQPRGIHRDFYADHVVVSGPRLCLLDFDLYCEGDPALDVGNFLGHLTEHSLRTQGDPGALADREEALEERFVALAGEATRAAVRAYATLTLVRHIYLSTQLPDRQFCTETLLELCEERLGNRQYLSPRRVRG